MSVSLRVGTRGAAAIAACGTIFVLVLIGLCLGVPALRHAPALEDYFASLAGLGCLLIALRPAAYAVERSAWVLFALAITANTTTEVLEVWAPGGHTSVAETVFGIATFPLAVIALVMMIRTRLGHLRAIAWLDGMTGALVVMTILAIAVLAPAATGGTGNAAKLVYPLADLLILGVVAAASADNGWGLNGWTMMGLGLALITAGDCVSAAHAAHPAAWPIALAAMLWLAAVWVLATSAWAPVPQRPADERRRMRGWVPMTLSVMMLALLLVATLEHDRWGVAVGLAVAGMLVVTARFGVTLRQNADVLRLMRTEATTDALTGLGNRRQLLRDLDGTLAQCTPGRPGGLAMFDLNGFKTYNDTYCHPAGDALLETLGAQLSDAVGASATAYRMGGDEFCVLIDCDTDSIPAVVARATEALSVRTREQTVTAAHGLALLPRDARTPSEALRVADLRMYENKNRGRIGPARQITQSLMLALEERNVGLPGRPEGIEELAVAVAQQFALPPAELERVRLAALLRNVGKIAVPDSVLAKSSPLSDAEWRLLRRHTLVGQRIIEAAPALQDVGTIVRSVYEQVDGQGYPDGLQGDEIPIGSRIIAVCNTYDAMTSARAYRAALTHDEALDEIRRQSGTAFDPKVVRAFLRVVPSQPTPGEAEIQVRELADHG
jgi:two-component system, cell cycle response regulator